MKKVTDCGYVYREFRDRALMWDHIITRAAELAGASPEDGEHRDIDLAISDKIFDLWEEMCRPCLPQGGVRSQVTHANMRHRVLGEVDLCVESVTWGQSRLSVALTHREATLDKRRAALKRYKHFVDQALKEGIAFRRGSAGRCYFLNAYFRDEALAQELVAREWYETLREEGKFRGEASDGQQRTGMGRNWLWYGTHSDCETRIRVFESRDILPLLVRRSNRCGLEGDMQKIRRQLERTRRDVERYETLCRDLWGVR